MFSCMLFIVVKLYDLQEVSESIAKRCSNDQMNIDIDELRRELEEAASIYAQADILHHLYVKKHVFLLFPCPIACITPAVF